MKTVSAKKEEIERAWHVVDAEGQVLGRLAVQVAVLLRGKNKPIFTPHVDTGDHVVVINADKVVMTGDKLRQKLYRRHSGYPGGLKEVSAGTLMREKPERVLTAAITGMLPKNKLGKHMATKLRVYRGATHPHVAQGPKPFALKSSRRGGS
ncbi:MAG: 50S ribosomal protein L13 [Nitrospirae bacterium]|nr:50S ribosomal protein L13 [Nitrospirota bacterium]